jgi:nucleotidyltransferase/DNA polymerase involved in DNA repair
MLIKPGAMQNLTNRTIFHLDMDAFFAAVEQLDFPQYRGKPVIVGADPLGGRGRGVVSTASYEARKFGIHSALPISQAYRACPTGIFVRPRGARYLEISGQIMRLLYDFTPLIAPISIDEAFMDMTGSLKLFGDARTIAIKVKQRIQDEIGLTASVGIAPNKFIAKIASDLQKPDGLVIVEAGKEKEFLAPLAISKMWGIGKKTEPLFHRRGIHTIGQLAGMTVDGLVKIFGKVGMDYWYLANGIDPRPVAVDEGVKSISKETTFFEDTDDCQKLELVLFEIAEILGKSLREKKLKARTITLKIRLADFSTFTRSKSLNNFTDNSLEIRNTGLALFRHFDCAQMKVRLIGLGVSQFDEELGEQLTFFDESLPQARNIDSLIDLVEDRFGKGMIKKATLMKSDDIEE